MSNPLRNSKVAWACAGAIAATAWIVPSLSAQFRSPLVQGIGPREPAAAEGVEPPPRIYYKAPISGEAAETWIKLGRKVPMRFPNETPLEEFIKRVKELTADKESPEGVMIYVDPVGLAEAEKTMASPITLDLANVKLETALRLALAQLDLRFYVASDGILMITSKDCKIEDKDAPEALILDRIDSLRTEVRQLRSAINARK
jgi:hypothetical protein